VNCILEAFGHAKTLKNNNSSRFIKLLTIQYCDKRKTLLRARVYAHMLEKSRLVHLPPQQHSFNIFHLMAEGQSPEENSALYLNNVLAHRYLSGRLPGENPPVAEASTESRERLTAVKHALRALCFNKQLLERGQCLPVTFPPVFLLGSLPALAKGQPFTCLVSLLVVCSGDLSNALISTFSDLSTRRHTVEMSEQYRDQLAKAIYGRLFSYLVNSTNEYLQGQDDSIGDPALEIGILDIFGFEEFERNGFEQLCVNMTNERLRQYVSEVLFQQEQAECLQEGIAMETPPTPATSQPSWTSFFRYVAGLDRFSPKPQGLLCVLDEESQSLRPAEQSLYKRLSAQLDSCPTHGLSLTTKDGNGNPPPKDQGPAFTVSHYAGQDATILLSLSQCPPTAPEVPDLSKILKKKGSSSFLQRLERCGPITVAVQLRNTLSEVMSKLQACTPHFVECVRPNTSGQPERFDSSHVSTQLQYIGVLEMVRMIRYGYPVRLSFPGFLSRYKDLVVPTLGDEKKLSPEERCRSTAVVSECVTLQMGSSKVFLR
ncbi:hypothetical protein KUCAC02_010521, partial [Chaenocephalus aceratus]